MKNSYRFLIKVFALIASFSLALVSCAQASEPSPTPEGPVKLRIAVLPILDTLPLYVAQEEGLFTKHNLEVEFIQVASAPERDQVIIAGQADGMINEALSTAFYNKDQIQVQIVRFAQAATEESALFRILAAANSGIKNVDDLKNVEIGISEGTVIDYLTNRLLQAEGFSPDEIATIAVPKIPDRMALLGTGELKAAMLPEPLSSLAVQQGAVVILDDTRHPELSFSTITFRKVVIDQYPVAIRAFLVAVEEAVALINPDPSRWNALLSDLKLVPQPLAGSFQVSKFVTAGVPSEAQWNDVLAWAKENGLLSQDVSYSDSINSSFLP